MFINVPNKTYKTDIKYLGKLYKDSGHSYILTDFNNSLELKSEGFYSYIYIIHNTYLFIVGNSKNRYDIEPNKINFMNKILEFEFLKNTTRKVKSFKVCNNFSVISKEVYQTFNERCFTDDFRHLNYEVVSNIVNKTKTHLQACKPLEKYCYYLQDNSNGYGLSENILSINTLYDKNLYVYKDTDITGYIVKYNNDLF